MAKKLKEQAKYDQAVKLLAELNFTPATFCKMVRAMDLVTALESADECFHNATLPDFIEVWSDSAYDDFEYELKEAWAMLEDV